jgi:hypothetical protein
MILSQARDDLYGTQKLEPVSRRLGMGQKVDELSMGAAKAEARQAEDLRLLRELADNRRKAAVAAFVDDERDVDELGKQEAEILAALARQRAEQ